MNHVTAIEKMIDEGDINQAFESLEQLLALGPNNIQALKLLAALYVHQGRFDEEQDVWRRIYEVDDEDEDVAEYFQKAQIEDREHYYFTDILPEGGRRFIAYPRSLIQISLFGLAGCISFLLLTRFTSSEQMTNSPVSVMVAFVVLVISPWIGIIITWSRSLRAVNVTNNSLEFSTRFKTHSFRWEDIQKISLAHSKHPNDQQLKLVVLPKEGQANSQPVAIDFSEDKSSIRARRYLISEIRSHQKTIEYDVFENLGLNKTNCISL
ncbi:MAG: tetratricopeptide repeat protein [Pseudobacteriovorax sp.]|nr:tetratricopeptide repeat protein [Pseudobacteriovorax sp.]